MKKIYGAERKWVKRRANSLKQKINKGDNHRGEITKIENVQSEKYI